MDISFVPLGVASGRQQAQFRIGPRPVSRPPKYCVSFPVQLDPDKSSGFVGKAPGFHDTPHLMEHGHSNPEEQGAVVSSQVRDWQSLDLLGGHSRIMALRRTPVAVFPGRVCVNDIVFSYSPNISFTMRSAPLTRPVRISILKISWPMYCQAIVTAGKLASAAGVLLDRKAE